MNLIDKVRRVLPGVRVEAEGDVVVIDLLLRLEPCVMQAKTIRTTVDVPGVVLILDTGEDVQEIAKSRNENLVVLAAVRWYSGWVAEQELAKIGNEEFAVEVAQEATPEWKAEVAAAIK